MSRDDDLELVRQMLDGDADESPPAKPGKKFAGAGARLPGENPYDKPVAGNSITWQEAINREKAKEAFYRSEEARIAMETSLGHLVPEKQCAELVTVAVSTVLEHMGAALVQLAVDLSQPADRNAALGAAEAIKTKATADAMAAIKRRGDELRRRAKK